jgi:hypothetical protein
MDPVLRGTLTAPGEVYTLEAATAAAADGVIGTRPGRSRDRRKQYFFVLQPVVFLYHGMRKRPSKAWWQFGHHGPDRLLGR